MRPVRPLVCLAALGIVSLPTMASAQGEDVTFFVIGKHANFDQQNDGRLLPVDYSFFSEIFFTESGDASNAFLNLPTGERIRFRDQRAAEGADKDNLLLIRGAKRFASYEELQDWYPDGRYGIEFDTPSGTVNADTLRFPENGLPHAPVIELTQERGPDCGLIDAGRDLVVRWTPFAQGRADINGVLDDLIFVIVEDESGRRVSHSGRPFEERPFLTYAESQHLIPAGTLENGRRYELSVEHALLTDTQRVDGVPAMTTYAVTTRRIIATGTDADCKQSGVTPMRPGTDAQVVMFYYADLAEADNFYGQVLGLEKTLDYDWVKFYSTSETSSVGLVAEGEGAWHTPQPKNAVMLSIVTSDVDGWYDELKARQSVRFLKEIADGGPIRSFLIEDPGGYTVEFFQWQ